MEENIIATLRTKIEEMEKRIKALGMAVTASAGVNKLEQALDNISGGGVETTNYSCKYSIKYNCEKNNSAHLNGTDIYFYCEPTDIVTVKVTSKGSETFQNETCTRGAYLYVNDEEVFQETYEQSTDYETNITYTFFPTQKLNKVKLKLQYGNVGYYKFVDYEFTGRNVMVLNSDEDLDLICFNNNYIITNKCNLSQAGISFNEQPVGSLNINNESWTIFNLINSGVAFGDDCTHPIFFPYWTIDETSGVCTLVPNKYFCNYANSKHSATITIDNMLQVAKVETLINHDSFCNATFCSEEGCVPTSYFTIGNVLCVSGSDEYYAEPFLFLNGVKLAAEYCTNTPIMNNNLGGETITFDTYLGCIGTRSDGMNIYYPARDSTYCVEIGKGRNCSAYYQPDGNINVYLNRFNNIEKYVLQKNAEDKYEIGARKTIAGYTRYIEGLSGEAIAKQNGKYIVLQNQVF